MKLVKFNPASDLVFTPKVEQMCRSCKRYGVKATCPPFCLTGDYYLNLLPRYAYGLFVVGEFARGTLTPEQAGKESSLVVHLAVLEYRNKLIRSGVCFAVGFGAGSCKMCQECSMPCKHPTKGLVPLEATGLNLVATCAPFGIKIEFPVQGKFYRIGAVFYD